MTFMTYILLFVTFFRFLPYFELIRVFSFFQCLPLYKLVNYTLYFYSFMVNLEILICLLNV